MTVAQTIKIFRKAKKCPQSAKILLDNKMNDDSLSRCYYAVMHAARSALYYHSVSPNSHSAVKNLFGDVLINSNEIETEYPYILSKEQDSRIYADYLYDSEFTEEQAQDFIEDAEGFVNRIQQYLLSKGIELPQTNDE